MQTILKHHKDSEVIAQGERVALRVSKSLVHLSQLCPGPSFCLADSARELSLSLTAAVADRLVVSTNGGVTGVLASQVSTEKELQKVAVEAAKFSEESKKWMLAFDGLRTALKELGDADNLMELIESDLSLVVNVVARVERKT